MENQEKKQQDLVNDTKLPMGESGQDSGGKVPNGGGGKVNFMNKNIMLIVLTAALLAVTVAVQYVGIVAFKALPMPFNTFLAGSLVNLCLFLSAAIVGIWGGAVIAIVTPFMSVLFGQLGFVVLAPFIGLGNFIIILIMWLAIKFMPKFIRGERVKIQQLVVIIVAVIIASALKFAFMYGVVVQLAPLLGVPTKAVQTVLQISYSWPQLVTALIGGTLFVPLIIALKKIKLFREIMSI